MNAATENKHPGPTTNTSPAVRGPVRVLVVDDNRDSAESLSLLVQLAANDVSVAYDGEQALKMADELEPDVVLLDIGLPKMNGYDVAREIRRQRWASGTQLVAITGWGQAEDKSLSRQAGIDHHLVKPVDPDALFGLIDKRKTGC
jgi:DNA-binding response OmpR family regulator